MADAASRTLSKANVMIGRVATISVGDGTDLKYTITGLNQEGVINVTEEVKEINTELEDYTDLVEVLARKVRVEITLSEIDDTDLDTINGATIDEIEIKTSTGGANGTGQTFNIQDCDNIAAFVDGLKTKIVATKAVAGNTITYTITDNAA
jgi:hypothetical protein